jgi:homoserine kinase
LTVPTVTVRVPATTANLGPGFDVLGLALDLWNEAVFTPAPAFALTIEGFGAGSLPADETNLVAQSALRLAAHSHKKLPSLHIHCRNRFPTGSGLGSSSAAILMGLLGANRFLAQPLRNAELLDLAVDIEGHPDNVTPALLGGLTVTALGSQGAVARQVSLAPWRVAVAVPEVALSTREMRLALRQEIPLRDAIFNLSRVPLVVEALRASDLPLLRQVMDDRLHQPYRLPHIPGAAQALDAARQLGGAAALSGAGPGVAAFALDEDTARAIGSAMSAAFRSAGLDCWLWVGGSARAGAQVQLSQP